jgi:hypothetical protein
MMIFPKKHYFFTSAHQKAPKSINLMFFSGNKRFEKNFDKQIQPQKQTHPRNTAWQITYATNTIYLPSLGTKIYLCFSQRTTKIKLENLIINLIQIIAQFSISSKAQRLVILDLKTTNYPLYHLHSQITHMETHNNSPI